MTAASLLMLNETVSGNRAWRGPKDVRARLDEGPGFVLLDRLPLDRMSRQEVVDLYFGAM